MKYIKLFENFINKLNESVDENYVVKPYEFETPEDWQNEYQPEVYQNIEITSETNPPQDEINKFEAYLEQKVEASESYGSENTFTGFIEQLLLRSMVEMFKVKQPNEGSYFYSIKPEYKDIENLIIDPYLGETVEKFLNGLPVAQRRIVAEMMRNDELKFEVLSNNAAATVDQDGYVILE